MNCRSCGGPTHEIFSLGKMPLVNELLDSPRSAYATYPLRVLLCEDCRLGQLQDIVPPSEMFEEYVYYSSVSAPILESAKTLVDRLAPTLPPDALVVEIGSNDGYLLQFYKEKGIRVLGIDPATGPSQVAIAKGIPTRSEFFTSALAATLPQADIIHANNVVAHIPDLHDLAFGIAILLKPSGLCVIEVHYLGSLLESCTFDTVYHEHVYYFSYLSLKTLFARYDLIIEEAELIPSQGGSLRVTLRKNGTERPPFVEDFSTSTSDMQSRIHSISSELTSTLLKLSRDGKRVWGFGAAAKATVMMNYCGIDDALIEAVADPTPAKQGKYIPGTGVRIVHPDEWLAARLDYTCIFAWNYAHKIAYKYAQHAQHAQYKGEFFTPYILPGALCIF